MGSRSRSQKSRQIDSLTPDEFKLGLKIAIAFEKSFGRTHG